MRAALGHELAQNFRVANDLAGATIAAVVRFDPDGSGRPIRFLEVVDPASPSRFAVYTNQREDVVFELVDRQGETRSVRVRQGLSGFTGGEFFVLGCEFGSSEALALMQIRVNDRVVEEWRSQDHMAVSAALDLAGAYSIMGTESEPNGGTFFLRELVLAEFLTFRDRLRLARYLFSRHFLEDMSPLQGPTVEFGPTASMSTRKLENRVPLRPASIVGRLMREEVTRLYLPHYVATRSPGAEMDSSDAIVREIDRERGIAVVEVGGIIYTIVCEHRSPTECQVYLVGSDGQRQILSLDERAPKTCPAVMDQIETAVTPLLVRMLL